MLRNLTGLIHIKKSMQKIDRYIYTHTHTINRLKTKILARERLLFYSPFPKFSFNLFCPTFLSTKDIKWVVFTLIQDFLFLFLLSVGLAVDSGLNCGQWSSWLTNQMNRYSNYMAWRFKIVD